MSKRWQMDDNGDKMMIKWWKKDDNDENWWQNDENIITEWQCRWVIQVLDERG